MRGYARYTTWWIPPKAQAPSPGRPTWSLQGRNHHLVEIQHQPWCCLQQQTLWLPLHATSRYHFPSCLRHLHFTCWFPLVEASSILFKKICCMSFVLQKPQALCGYLVPTMLFHHRGSEDTSSLHPQHFRCNSRWGTSADSLLAFVQSVHFLFTTWLRGRYLEYWMAWFQPYQNRQIRGWYKILKEFLWIFTLLHQIITQKSIIRVKT